MASQGPAIFVLNLFHQDRLKAPSVLPHNPMHDDSHSVHTSDKHRAASISPAPNNMAVPFPCPSRIEINPKVCSFDNPFATRSTTSSSLGGSRSSLGKPVTTPLTVQKIQQLSEDIIWLRWHKHKPFINLTSAVLKEIEQLVSNRERSERPRESEQLQH